MRCRLFCLGVEGCVLATLEKADVPEKDMVIKYPYCSQQNYLAEVECDAQHLIQNRIT